MSYIKIRKIARPVAAIVFMTIFLNACNPSGNRASYSKLPFDPYMDDGTSLRSLEERDSLAREHTIHLDTASHMKDSTVKPAADTSVHSP